MASPRLTVAVFCGSSFGHDPVFHEAAVALGDGLARAGMRLVAQGRHKNREQIVRRYKEVLARIVK